MDTACSTTAAQATAGKYLTFSLALETYGIEVLRVREIVGISSITAVPNTPAFIKGVMNLRGKIIPLVDLRLKFGMASSEYTRETCVVVVETAGVRETILIGVIVDAVREVIDVSAAELSAIPSFGVRVNTAFLSGLANARSGLILLLDIDHVLSREELTCVEETRDEAALQDGAEIESESPDMKEAKI